MIETSTNLIDFSFNAVMAAQGDQFGALQYASKYFIINPLNLKRHGKLLLWLNLLR